MMIRTFACAMVLLATSAATPVLAEWTVEKDAISDNFWRVTNSESGQTLVKAYKSEKQAKKAAKALNKGDKSVMATPDGQSDFRLGGELPK